MTGVLVRQIMIAVGVVEADGAFRMVLGRRGLPKEEIVCPEHVLGLDRETGIAVVLSHASPSAGQFLRRCRLTAEHVVLGSPAQRREQTRLVADLTAKFLGA